MPTLDPARLPTALVPLISMAEKWGIGDDFERDALIRSASNDELNELIHCIDYITDDDLYGWLSGPESFKLEPTDEYLAITGLTMAIDSAKVRLRKSAPAP